MSTKITRVHARQDIDSRGNPTVEADVTLTSGAVDRAQSLIQIARVRLIRES